jgi:hypothetical protein
MGKPLVLPCLRCGCYTCSDTELASRVVGNSALIQELEAGQEKSIEMKHGAGYLHRGGLAAGIGGRAS